MPYRGRPQLRGVFFMNQSEMVFGSNLVRTSAPYHSAPPGFKTSGGGSCRVPTWPLHTKVAVRRTENPPRLSQKLPSSTQYTTKNHRGGAGGGRFTSPPRLGGDQRNPTACHTCCDLRGDGFTASHAMFPDNFILCCGGRG